MNTRQLRVAIAGGGMIAGLHRRGALLGGAQIVGVLGSTAKRSREIADQWHIEQGYSDLDALLANRPDVLHICTPNRLHAPMALTALEAGINVVCEKPLGSAAAFSGGGGGELVDVATEDIALAHFLTGSGITVATTISQVSAGRKNRLWFELDGTLGSAVFDQEHPEEATLATMSQTAVIVRDPRTNALDAARLSALPAGHAQGYAHCFEAFIADTYAAIRGDQPEGLPTFSDGARAARVVDAVLDSAASRSWVPIDRAVS